MELEKIVNWLSTLICENPVWSVVGAIFTPTALIQLRSFYLNYYSRIKIEISEPKILPNNANRNVPRGMYYYCVEARLSRKTRKTIHLKPIECRIVSDTITTSWHRDNWSSRGVTLDNSKSKVIQCNFFERQDLDTYQFEVKVEEDGTNKVWKAKSKKYGIDQSRLIECK